MKIYKFYSLVIYIIVLSGCLFSQNDKEKYPVKGYTLNPLFLHQSNAPEDAYYKMMEQKFAMQKKYGYYLQDEKWRSLGPTPVNFYGTSAGRVSTVAYDPRDISGNTMYLGGAQGGVWKSTDGGLHWQPKTDNEKALASGSIAIDPNLSGSHSIIYCGTGEGVWFGGAPYSGCGILKSTDAGETWTLHRKGLPYRTIFYKVVVNPKNPKQLFAALQTGLYRSTNSGESWKKIIPSDTSSRQCTDVAVSPDGKKVYAIGPSSEYKFYPSIGYWISEDGGKNFTKHEFTTLENRRTKIEICENEPNYVYILFDMGETTVLSRSSDGGYTFSEVMLGGGGGNAGYNLMLAVHPNDHRIVYFGLANLYKSLDWGSTFCCIGTLGYWGCNACNETDAASAIHPDIHAMDFNPSNPDKILVGCDGGVYTSDNAGQSWNITLNTTLTLTQFGRFTSSPFNPDLLGGGAQDMGMMYKPRADGLAWNISMIGDGANLVSSETVPNVVVGNMAGSIPGIIYYSTDGGLGYTVSAGSNGKYDSGYPIIPIISHPTEPGVFFMLKNQDMGNVSGPLRVLMSTDNGANFNEDKPYSIVPTTQIPQNIAVSESNPDIMYITTGNLMPEWHFPNHIYKYDRATGSWADLFQYHSDVIPDKLFSSLMVDPKNENIVYVGLAGFKTQHLFKSTNGGRKWFNISGNLPDGPINDLEMFYTDENQRNILAGTDAGVFVSTNEGETWREYGEGLPNCLITSIFYNRVSCKLRVSTYGRGIWEILVPGKIYVNDVLVLNSDDKGTKIEDDIVVAKGGKLIFPFACKIIMKEGKKITVQDGGTIDAKGNSVTFQSQSGSWDGIILEGDAVGNLENCKFENTSSVPVQKK